MCILSAIISAILLLPAIVGAEVIDKLKIHAVALTFDTCETKPPSYFDEKILSYLVREEIPFTVFMTGKFAKRNSMRLQELARLTFVEIENHSFNHYQHMERLSDNDVRCEVKELDDLMMRIIGKKTKYFRFPGGNYDERTLRIIEEMGYKVVNWSFPSGDPDRKVTPEKLTRWVASKSRRGNVLVFHINGRGYSTGEALPMIINSLREKGLKFTKMDDGGL
jgi:peptidoglycan-N-acetylglucosamine deacetylase